MALTYPGVIEALEISSIYSDFVPDGFGLLLEMLWSWCRDKVGQGAGDWVLKGVNYGRGRLLLKQMTHLHNNIIHVVRSKFHVSMLSLPFHFCYAVISLQLEVVQLSFGWSLVQSRASGKNGEMWWDWRRCVDLSLK